MPNKPASARKQVPESPVTIVRDPETGRTLPLYGYGALKGQFEIRPGIDLTKPIYEQVLKLDALEERDSEVEVRESSSGG
jgi:hypothetical protein